MKVVPVNRPYVSFSDFISVNTMLVNRNLSGEVEKIQKTEEKFVGLHGGGYSALVSNGTVALELALRALGIRSGDEVIVPTLTIISCLTPIIELGATPIFVDSNLSDWQPRLDEILKKITGKTRAIVFVHLYGLATDLTSLRKICDAKGIFLLEDCSQALGIKFENQGQSIARVGTIGHIATFSFYANKIVTSGEGGLVYSRNLDLIERVKFLRNLAFDPNRRFVHSEFSSNSRMSGIQAALLNSQLNRLEKNLKHRKKIAQMYHKLLKNLELELPPKNNGDCENIFWVYAIVLPKELKIKSTQLISKLASLGVASRPFFFPLHLQPALRLTKQESKKHKEQMPNSNNAYDLYERGLYLPTGNAITMNEVKRVARAIKMSLPNLRQ